MNDKRTAAVHEAGHAVVLMHCGYAPRSLAIDDIGGGECSLPETISARAKAMTALAGCLAVEVLAESDEGWSASDSDLFRDATAAVGGRAMLLAMQPEVSRLVFKLSGEIEAVAAALLKHGQLDHEEIGTLCRRTPALQRFEKMFPRPERPAPVAAMSTRSRPAEPWATIPDFWALAGFSSERECFEAMGVV